MTTNNAFHKILANVEKLKKEEDLLAYPILVARDITEDQLRVLEEIVRDKLEEIKASRDGGISYPLYAHEDFSVATKSWKELNPNNLSYWKWLIKEGLPRFWIQPRPEFQHILLAVACGVNSNAIPFRTPKARKEVSLPLLYFYGESGSGKTEGNFIIGQSYPYARQGLIKGEATGCALRNYSHLLCYREDGGDVPGKNNLYPSFMIIDNYEPVFLQKWGEYKTILLSVLRSQAYTSTANRDGTNQTYYTHLLKSFTSVIPPKSMNLAQSEFNRRFLYFFTAKSQEVKSIANYDFSDIPEYYNSFWADRENMQSFYKGLAKLLGKDDNETSVPAHRWQQSILFIVVGKTLGLFGSLAEGIDFFSSYWEWVEYEIENSTTEVSTLVECLIEEKLSTWISTKLEQCSIALEDLECLPQYQVRISTKELRDAINRAFVDKRNKDKACVDYLKQVRKFHYGVDRNNNNEAYYYLLPSEAILLARELKILI